jgi:hypothetical protein
MDVLTSQGESRFEPSFEPYNRGGQLLWRACCYGRCGVGITQTAALQQLRHILIAADLLLPGERREMG